MLIMTWYFGCYGTEAKSNQRCSMDFTINIDQFLPFGKAVYCRISFVGKGSQYLSTTSPMPPRLSSILGFCNIEVTFIK